MNSKLCDSGTARNVGAVIDALLYHDAWRTVKYVGERFVISATRKRFGSRGWTGRDRTAEIVVKIGAPNYMERRFIALCKKSGETFPVEKVQLKMLPVPRG